MQGKCNGWQAAGWTLGSAVPTSSVSPVTVLHSKVCALTRGHQDAELTVGQAEALRRDLQRQELGSKAGELQHCCILSC